MSHTFCRCCRASYTRRDILKASGAGTLLATAASALSAPIAAAEGDAQVIASARSLLKPVSISAIRLLPGSVFHDRLELHRRGYLSRFDPDRLLFHYRALAGLPQAAGTSAGYKGWESGFLRGHMAGHYLSAASRMAIATDDSSFHKRVEYMVHELSKCQEAIGAEGYLAAFSPVVFDWVEGKSADNGEIVVPYYTVHKLMAGLLDAHVLLAAPHALPVITKMADYFAKRCASLDAPAPANRATFQSCMVRRTARTRRGPARRSACQYSYRAGDRYRALREPHWRSAAGYGCGKLLAAQGRSTVGDDWCKREGDAALKTASPPRKQCYLFDRLF